MLNLTSAQLRQAAELKDRIAVLDKELAALLGAGADGSTAATAAPVRAKKRGMSAAGRAAVAAAQKARWAKINAAKAKSAAPAPAAKPAKKKFKMSAAGRARIIAAQKARWAKVKAAKQ